MKETEVEMKEVPELVAEVEAKIMVEEDSEIGCTVAVEVANTEDKLVEELAVESEVGGVEIEQETEPEAKEIIEVELGPKEEELAMAQTTDTIVEDCGLTEAPISPITEDAEAQEDVEKLIEAEPVETQATELLPTPETFEEAVLEFESVVPSEPTETTAKAVETETSAPATEEADSEIGAPKEELKEPKSPKPSRKSKLPKKLGSKKAKK